MRTWLIAAGVAVALLAAVPVQAVTVTWNTCKDGSDSGFLCNPGDTLHPSGLMPSPFTGLLGTTGALEFRGFVSEILDPTRLLTVRSFKTGTLGSGALSATGIDLFEGGLGAGLEASPEHALDNIGPDEILVFKLGQDGYVPKSFRIGWRETDADIVTYIGGTGAQDLFALFGAGFNWNSTGGDLTATMGFRREVFPGNPDTSSVPVGVDVNFNSVNNDPLGPASGRWLVIAARNEKDGTADGGEDKFKVQQIVGVTPSVPEPSSLALLALGVTAIAALRRRRP